MNLASLFHKKAEPEPVDSLDTAIAEAKAHADAVKATLKSVIEHQAEARARLEIAESRVRAALAKRDQTLLDGGDLTLVTQVIAGAQREVEAAREELIGADRDVEAATAAAVRAGEELSAAKRAKKVTELRERASIATLNAKIEAPAKRILELRKQMAEAAAEMDRAIVESHAATTELVKMGEAASPVRTFHLLGPFIRASLAEDASRAPALLNLMTGELTTIAHTFEPNPAVHIGSTVQHAFVPNRDAIARILSASSSSSGHEYASDYLDVLFAEGEEAAQEFQKERACERQQLLRNQPPPTPGPDGWIDMGHGARSRVQMLSDK